MTVLRCSISEILASTKPFTPKSETVNEATALPVITASNKSLSP